MTAKHEMILTTVRREIVDGRFPPGSILPTRSQYEERFAATAPTVQKAFDRLREDGFIDIRHRVGTFVSARPPHRYHYGLTFPYPRGQWPRWSRFHEALLAEADAVANRLGRRFSFYDGLVEPGGACVDRLVRDLAAHRVAGVIHASFLCPTDARLQHARGIPMVGIGNPSQFPKDCSVAYLDYLSILERGARLLVDRGVRQVAVLEDAEGLGGEVLSPDRMEVLNRHGLRLAPNGYISLPASHAEAGRHWVRLLMNQPPGDRPQSLFIMDDNLVAAVVKGVADVGLKVPDDLCIICHNNFPMELPKDVPLVILGFHAGHLLTSAIEHIDRCRAKQDTPRTMTFPAMKVEETEALITAWRNIPLVNEGALL